MMMRVTRLFQLAAAVVILVAASADAVSYQQVYGLDDIKGSSTALEWLDAVVVAPDGTTTYAIPRENGLQPTAHEVIKVENTGQVSQTASVLMTTAQFDAFDPANNLAGGYGAEVVGNNLLFVNFFSNSVVQVDLSTGTPSDFISRSDLDTFLGNTDSNIGAQNKVNPAGGITFYESDTDQILESDAAGNLSVLISDTQLTALAGSDSLNGGMTYDAAGNLIFGSNSSDSIYSWDPVAGSGTEILTTAQITAVSGASGSGYGDFLYAPDGNVYYYDSSADSILSFDPTDPVNTLAVIINDVDLAAGPGMSDIVLKLAWFEDNIGWTVGGGGSRVPGFYVIPEPASLALLAVGGVALLRRRR